MTESRPNKSGHKYKPETLLKKTMIKCFLLLSFKPYGLANSGQGIRSSHYKQRQKDLSGGDVAFQARLKRN